MRNISLIFKQFSRTVLLVAGFAAMGLTARAQGDAAKGEALFKANCTACHKIDVRMTGPALGPTISSETDDKWLTKWIQNNQALIAAKDPKALKIYNEFNGAGMTVFTQLSDGDVANIIAYVRDDWKKMQAAPKPGGPGGAAAETGPSDIMIAGLIAVIVIALIVILVLNRAIGSLEKILVKKQAEPVVEEEEVETAPVDRFATAKKLIKNKKLVFFVLVCGTIAFSAWSWVIMWNTNVHQGYQPTQPIKYSHELHAGVMKINCQYCHFNAYKGKNAAIPSLNVCMNCHKTVKTESPEIHKIYDALGYDPQTQKYDSTKAKPIQWVRIHNLPDFVYFNHAQHVRVGGIACQTCHGPIQRMQQVYQYSPLTMKWCIQCHKRTDIKGKGNNYYEQMLAVHDRIKKGEHITEAQMGGLECSKCHY